MLGTQLPVGAVCVLCRTMPEIMTFDFDKTKKQHRKSALFSQQICNGEAQRFSHPSFYSLVTSLPRENAHTHLIPKCNKIILHFLEVYFVQIKLPKTRMKTLTLLKHTAWCFLVGNCARTNECEISRWKMMSRRQSMTMPWVVYVRK